MGSATKLIIGEVTGSQSSGLAIQKEGGNVGIGTAAPSSPLHVYGNLNGSYVTIIDNDQNTNGHVLKLLTDGNGTGSRLLEMEDGDGDIIFRARADGRFGFGPDGVSSMGAGTFVVGIDNSSHTSDIAISKRLQHLGDSNTYLDFPSADTFNLVAGGGSFLKFDNSSSKILINNANSDRATQVMANDGNVVLHVDAGDNRVGVGTATPISELDVAGKISITSESATPSQPADGQGYLYTKTDGKLYWRSYDVSETDLTSGGGGGSSTDRFVMTQAIEQVNSMSTSYYYYKNVTGGYGWTNTFSTTNFATSFPYWRVSRYASSGTVPIGANLTAYHIVGHKDGSDNDTITVKVWKVPAPTNGDAETDIPTLVEIISVELNVDGNQMFNKNGTLSSSNSFSAGDQWMVTLNATSAYMTSDHYAHLSLVFEPS